MKTPVQHIFSLYVALSPEEKAQFRAMVEGYEYTQQQTEAPAPTATRKPRKKKQEAAATEG